MTVQVESYFASKEPNKRLYTIVTIKYKDSAMKDDERGVVEQCGYIIGNDSPIHECGRIRTFIEHVQ